MVFPTRARSAGVTAADRGRAVPGSARAAARRAPQVLKRSCQPGCCECPAGACARLAERTVCHFAYRGRDTPRWIPRRTPHGALRAPLKTLEKVLTGSGALGCAVPLDA